MTETPSFRPGGVSPLGDTIEDLLNISSSQGRVDVCYDEGVQLASMQGRQFVVDDGGKASAVLPPIDECRRLLERAQDAEDLALIDSRRNEPDISVVAAVVEQHPHHGRARWWFRPPACA